MALLSQEAERELLDIVDRRFNELIAFQQEHNDGWDLITRAEAMEKLGVSSTTLVKWERLGLKVYQSPFEHSRKIYYRKSDIYKFLAVS